MFLSVVDAGSVPSLKFYVYLPLLKHNFASFYCVWLNVMVLHISWW